MDLSKKGISSAAKAAAIIAAVMVVLAVVYFVPSFSTSSVGAAPASSNTRTSSSGPVTQNAGILALFGFFSQIDMQVTVLNYNQANGIIQQQSLSYLVLGKGTWNSTQYTRVEFSTPGVGNTVVAWFNAQGGIDRVDVLGQRNYTGSGAYFVASTYVNALTLVPYDNQQLDPALDAQQDGREHDEHRPDPGGPHNLLARDPHRTIL